MFTDKNINGPEIAKGSEIKTLQDLITALDTQVPAKPQLPMLKTTVGKTSYYLRVPPTQIAIQVLSQIKPGFRAYLISCRLADNSVKSYMSYLGMLETEAINLGWHPEPETTPAEWIPITTALASSEGKRIWKFAIAKGLLPSEVNEEAISQAKIAMAQEGLSSNYARTVRYWFLFDLKKNQLQHLFPQLNFTTRKAYGIPIDRFKEPLRSEVRTMVANRQDDAGINDQGGSGKKIRAISATVLESWISRLYGYAVSTIGHEPTTLPELLERQFVVSFINYCLRDRGMNPVSFSEQFWMVYAAVRDDGRWADLGLSWLPVILQSLLRRDSGGRKERRNMRYIKYSVLEQIPKLIERSFNENVG